MRKIILLAALALCLAPTAGAETIPVRNYRHNGPFPLQTPFLIDSVNVKSEAFQPFSASGRISFDFENSRFAPVTVHIEGPVKDYKLFVDGKPAGGPLKLAPGTHRAEIEYRLKSGQEPSMDISLETPEDGVLALREDGKHRYGMGDVLLGTRFSGVSLSPDGKWMITSYSTTREGGKVERSSRLSEVATGRVGTRTVERIAWMPRSNKYYFTQRESDGLRILAVDPATGAQETLAEGVPEGMFQFAPTEDFLIYMQREEGPKEKEGIYQILTPDDRQPGWRSRSYPAKYDLKTGVM